MRRQRLRCPPVRGPVCATSSVAVAALVLVLVAPALPSAAAEPAPSAAPDAESSPGPNPVPALVPDATRAEIDGRVAMGFWPARDGEVLGPEGFTVHLVDDAALEEELVYPAGHWFQPPPGWYKHWVEGPGWVSPAFNLLKYSGSPFRGRGMAGLMDVMPAGRVALAPEVELEADHSVRLVHLQAVRDGRIGRGFMRAITPQNRTAPVRVPLGEVVGLLYDRDAARYVAASPPAEVTADGVAAVHPAAERGRSDLFVVLRRPRPVADAARDDVEPLLSTGDRPHRAPDVLVPTWEWVYALWYDVGARLATLEVRSERVRLEPTEVTLRPGGVETVRGALRPRPAVDARVVLPETLRPQGLRLVVQRRSDRRVLVERELPPDLGPGAVTRVEGLPAVELRASLVVDADPGWTVHRHVDLTDGLDREIELRVDPVVLTGTVYHGDEPAAATLRFVTDRHQPDDRLVVETDEAGRYTAHLYGAGRFPMLVDVHDRPGPPFRVALPPYVVADRTLDVHVPRSTARVTVRDAVDGRPVAGARVILDNRHDRDGDGTEEAVSSHNQPTGGDGVASMPPLFPGSVRVLAEADGYLRSAAAEATLAADETLELSVDLEPAGGGTPLALRLSDGRPAAGAEVRAQRTVGDSGLSPNGGPPRGGGLLWSGRTDGGGRLEVPERVRGAWLLIRHPESGSRLRRWGLREGEPSAAPTSWTLPPAAGRLVLRTVSPGGEAVPWTPLALHLPDAGWVSGRTLAWLAGTAVAGTDDRGLWSSDRLPAGRLRAAAGSTETLQLVLRGRLTAAERRLDSPWPDTPVELAVPVR